MVVGWSVGLVGGGGSLEIEMTLVKWTMVVYGVVLLGMGIQSYFFPSEGVDPSIISLIAAGGMGLIVLGMTALSFKHPRPAYIVTVVLAAMTIGRFMPKVGEGQIYPATVAAGLSLLTIVVLGAGHMKAMADKKKQAR